jgi:hypothetical protein
MTATSDRLVAGFVVGSRVAAVSGDHQRWRIVGTWARTDVAEMRPKA